MVGLPRTAVLFEPDSGSGPVVVIGTILTVRVLSVSGMELLSGDDLAFIVDDSYRGECILSQLGCIYRWF